MIDTSNLIVSNLTTWRRKNVHTYKAKGPWDDEPDSAYWQYKGLDCAIVRSYMGALCGYVGVPSNHPLYGIDYYDIHRSCSYTSEVPVELTFSNTALAYIELTIIVNNSEVLCEDAWWLGFDCAHFGDLIPAMLNVVRDFDFGSYKDFACVVDKVNMMADVLAEDLPKTKVNHGRVINVEDVESKDYTPLSTSKRILKL